MIYTVINVMRSVLIDIDWTGLDLTSVTSDNPELRKGTHI